MATFGERKEPPKLTEYELTCAARDCFTYKYFFCNVYYRTFFEADGFVVTNSGYGIELEAKLTRSDWVNDFKKTKHQDPRFIKHFYYCVPEELASNPPEGIPEKCGIIKVYADNNGTWRGTIIKRSQDFKCGKLPDHVLLQMFKSFYYRYWDLRARFFDYKREYDILIKETTKLRAEAAYQLRKQEATHDQP